MWGFLDSNLITSALITGTRRPARVLEARRPRPFDMVLSEKQSEALRRATRYEWVRPSISAHAQDHVCGYMPQQAQEAAVRKSGAPHGNACEFPSSLVEGPRTRGSLNARAIG